MSQSTLVVGAMAFELAGLVPRDSTELRRIVTGTGPVKARAGLERALSGGVPQRIIALGLCGGLSPGEAPGSVAVPEEIVSREGKRAVGCAPWPGLENSGRLVTVDSPVSTPSEKAGLRAVTGADWVDMESYVWADMAEEYGVPFTVLRVVVDGWNESLPNVNSPRTWSSALSLPQKSFYARKILHQAARSILCGR